MRKILVMTDLHMRAEGQRIIGLDPGMRLDAALDHALTRHADAEALILCGDLAHAGVADEYRRLRRILARCPIPVIPLLGNHDRRDSFRLVFPDVPTTSDGHVQSVTDLGDTTIITLDTLDGPPFGRTHVGRLDAARLDWLDRTLAGAAGRQLLVCAHHPPMPVGIPAMDAIALADGEQMIERLAAHDAPVHLICGHLHRTVSGMAHGVPFTVLKGTCHQGPLDLHSLDSSLSVDEPGAYGVVLLSPGRIVVHSEDVLAGGNIISGYDDPR